MVSHHTLITANLVLNSSGRVSASCCTSASVWESAAIFFVNASSNPRPILGSGKGLTRVGALQNPLLHIVSSGLLISSYASWASVPQPQLDLLLALKRFDLSVLRDCTLCQNVQDTVFRITVFVMCWMSSLISSASSSVTMILIWLFVIAEAFYFWIANVLGQTFDTCPPPFWISRWKRSCIVSL